MAKNSYTLGQKNYNNNGGFAARGMSVREKPKDFKGAWMMILKYCLRFGKKIVYGLSFALIGSILRLFTPGILQKITDHISDNIVTGNIDFGFIRNQALLLASIYVVFCILTIFQTYMMACATHDVQETMRNDVEAKINRMPLKSFDSSSFGDLMAKVSNDVDTIGMSLNNTIETIFRGCCTIIGTSVMMLITNVKLGLISIAISSIGFAAMNMLTSYSQKFFSNRSYTIGRLYGSIEEIYAGHTIVKSNNGEDETRAEFESLNNELYNHNWKSVFFSGMMMPIMSLVNNLTFASICCIGAIMTKNGEISFGTIIEFIAYMRLYTRPLEQISSSITNLMSAASGGERVFNFLKEEELESEEGKPNDFKVKEGNVVFNHVKFGYDPEKLIIKDFSIDVPAGSRVAIVGPTGAGKTTLVNLLMRFYEIQDGEITIDGVDLRSITRENVRDLFSMVLQDSWMFEGTVKENVVFQAKDVPDERIIEVCKSVGLHNFFSSLPKGYDTVLTAGTNLSAGQMQLLTIARAMIKNSPLLILDEATSAIDTRTEKIVQQAMEKLTEGRTSFTIAHRLSTIRNADIILVLKDGDIVETGKHDELLAKNGFYAELWNSQFTEGNEI